MTQPIAPVLPSSRMLLECPEGLENISCVRPISGFVCQCFSSPFSFSPFKKVHLTSVRVNSSQTLKDDHLASIGHLTQSEWTWISVYFSLGWIRSDRTSVSSLYSWCIETIYFQLNFLYAVFVKMFHFSKFNLGKDCSYAQIWFSEWYLSASANWINT